MGQTSRPGAYSIPGKAQVTRWQLSASAGGLAEEDAGDDRLLRIVRRQGDNSELVTTFNYHEVLDGGEPFFLEPNDLIRVVIDPKRRAEAAPTMITIDLLPLFDLALADESVPNNFTSSDWLAERQDQFAGHVEEVLIGMGHERDLNAVTAWMGVLTVVGSPAAITDTQNYIEQTQQTIRERAIRSKQTSTDSTTSSSIRIFGSSEDGATMEGDHQSITAAEIVLELSDTPGSSR